MSGNLVIFDFDGTLTTSDSFVRFALRTVGRSRFLGSVLRCAPYLAAWKCRLIPGGKAKERLFGALYAGRTHRWLLENGKEFAREIARIERPETFAALDRHIADGDNVYIVSASLSEWITPWANSHSVSSDHVIATICEVSGRGILTGRFASENCYGAEKVRRLRQAVGALSRYHITVYGDSKGDRELFGIAQEAIHI